MPSIGLRGASVFGSGLDTEGPLSGYEIRRTVFDLGAESIGFFWTESFGQLYAEIKRLSGEKLIAARRLIQLAFIGPAWPVRQR